MARLTEQQVAGAIGTLNGHAVRLLMKEVEYGGCREHCYHCMYSHQPCAEEGNICNWFLPISRRLRVWRYFQEATINAQATEGLMGDDRIMGEDQDEFIKVGD